MAFFALDADSFWEFNCLSNSATLSKRISSCCVEVSIEVSDITLVRSASVLARSASLSLSER